MTKVLGPLNSGWASGKYNDVVFSYNQHGPYVRTFTPATDPNTTQQQNWRSAFGQMSAAWSDGTSLTQAQRDGWNNFAAQNAVVGRLGQKKYITGQNWFIRCNAPRIYAGFGFRNFPPLFPGPQYFADISITQGVDKSLYFDVDPQPQNEEFIIVSRVLNQSTGRSFRPNDQTEAALVDINTSLPILVASENLLTDGVHRHFFKVTFYDNNGVKSSPLETYIDAAPLTEASAEIENYNALFHASPNTVFNSSDRFIFAESGSENHGIFRVDLADFPDQDPFFEVLLDITIFDWDTTFTLGMHRLLKDNAVGEATWNERLTSTAWGVPGGESSVDYEATAAASRIITGNGLFSFDITNLFNDWMDGSVDNYGIILIPQSVSDTRVWTEQAATASNRPTVRVSY